MTKSATDATRFTSTMPHASAKPSPSRPQKKGTPGPAGETPREKVARLRAAADLARNSQVTAVDRFLVRGRVWADRAHKITAVTLMGATFVAGIVTVYALGDMMVYNRKKRAEFFAEQKAQHASAIENARLKVQTGSANEEDIRFLALADAHAAEIEAKARAKAENSIFNKGKQFLFSGLKREEGGDEVGTGENRLGYEGLSEEDDVMGERESDIVRAIEEKKMGIADKAKHAFENEKERQRSGGPLDRIGAASNKNGDEQPKSNGWFSWMTGR
ncbi:hypothetical protein LHYA1_G002985 [Lachnellula hyalina]|uniref:Uncharacterized protein n=1 Tax=Lachnellula hyalina TaxID=1316788 RepID=A0A8H8U0Y2_9HELO|nr:uncharacterized protein LHYA1_G002985 [Lachnellula hyalina]TVY27337.1 hypothetical protein LHYA1_G002985 [Lachnellula hyalina]